MIRTRESPVSRLITRDRSGPTLLACSLEEKLGGGWNYPACFGSVTSGHGEAFSACGPSGARTIRSKLKILCVRLREKPERFDVIYDRRRV